INVYSEPAKGTDFAFYVPAADVGEELGEQTERPQLPHGHGELILVVDDEASIREVTSATLQAFGYSVICASDGTEAVALFAQRRNDIKVVVTDMMMPYMDGSATIRALRKLDPNLNIIATSGLSGTAKASEATEAGVKFFLPKPYTADKLLRMLADILAAKSK
ncbi:MAG TPA: response regulator, partial [Blastocatellia bacterium]|nr:response regulator [Blastocatellia bacterium]